ncbi:MAG: pseudouridine synthase [Limosilactobacillus sp.]|uniref:pseudouridine synthase n=1 Tax=Limosilactobacillus sp. TaxID=2773925 RepID=UPI00270DACCC|nr:pseudouridine synthase [Limosilactobacillus sp.]
MERLQKVMAQAGVASRRASEKLITQGRVTVNGETIRELGTKVAAKDKIEVDGVPIHHENHVYYLLNKPRGVISSASDEKGRRTVVDIFKDDEIEERIYPVGRLDYDTTGILLMTNDGDVANKLMHPKFEVNKTYIAKVKGLISNEELKQLRLGVVVDGHKTKPAKTRLKETDRTKKTSIVQLTIHEGHYHQVKKMFEVVGHPVVKLHRESYGFLNCQGVQPGEYRELRPEEVKRLKEL